MRILWEAGRFDHFDGQVYEGRWGSVVHAVGEVLGRADLLRRGWSKAAFLNKDGVEDNGREDSVNVDLADEAIQSGLFWAYARMVQKVGAILHELAVWGESCPCHWDQAVTHGRAPHVRRQRFQNTFGVESCPVRTLQAPACAAGFQFELLGRLLQCAHNGLLMDPPRVYGVVTPKSVCFNFYSKPVSRKTERGPPQTTKHKNFVRGGRGARRPGSTSTVASCPQARSSSRRWRTCCA